MRRLALLVPLAALLALSPLLFWGWSCGKDLPFHVQSWVDAAAQFRQGTVYPRWTFAAAYNSGEPRFTFYPPLSWALGGALAMFLPIAAVPAVFAWMALSAAGWTMYRLARLWVGPGAALVAGCVFLANPYMLYTVAMRGAFGELLAAAWCPLLFAAMLERRPSPWRIGLPLGLLWLCNVPGAVIGMYLFAVLAVLRLAMAWRGQEGLPGGRRVRGVLGRAWVFAGGLGFGLALAGMYLAPSLYERHLIRMEDAYSPGMRVVDNLLLQRRLDPVRDAFLLHVEHIALGMGVCTFLLLGFAWWRGRRGEEARLRCVWRAWGGPVLAVAIVVVFMLLAPSAPLWRTLPVLWVTQLPWRVLFVLGCCLASGVAMVLAPLRWTGARARVLSLAVVAGLAFPAMHSFRRDCDVGNSPEAMEAALGRHHAPEPTEEYVLDDADAEYMRPDNPPFWLTADALAFAPGTTPNTTHDDPTAPMPKARVEARLAATPLRFRVSSGVPMFLVVNLEDYPKWVVRRNGGIVQAIVHRPDGLIAFPLTKGTSEIAITWRHSADEWEGGLLTAGAVMVWVFSAWRRRRMAVIA